ncbi:IclR family transcriptional regulator [Paenibacillus cymbidii]|uniref:IclR family transcriptional regulator n=1 Tax=Paenibacillus cymbidii TaxID=1639034 RepID=UPI001F276D1C|nr:IclR family transcriptional regulator [Paenibacillus cymbidii]
MLESKAHKVKSADRVLDIFELFTGGADSYNLSEIAKSLNMPPSSTYLLLQNMLDRGYLEVDKSGKQFRIGYKLFTIRSRYMQNTSLMGEFFHLAGKITEELNETISIAVRNGNRLLYLGEKVSSQALRYTPVPGEAFPLHATASGKILLADLSEKELFALYPHEELERITDKTISTRNELLQELEKVRQTGYGYNLGETVDGVHCMAGKIVNADDKAMASISISIPAARITSELWQRVHLIIKQACEEMSCKLFQ